ncbi:MAG: S41 family peptidase [Wenzhouxiangella sp.]|jgi:carboxyl-terminal processing protease|nr:S41 family peptidase [Wenzhouxiangella sp.]
MLSVLCRIQATCLLSALLIVGASLAQAEDSPMARAELVERAIATAEAALPNPAFLSSSEWTEFKQTIRNPDVLTLNDVEFHRVFNEATHQLPFTHFRLHWQPRSGGEGDEAPISLSWPRDDIAVVRIQAFKGDPMAISETLEEVIARRATALVIDLRGNSGGSFPTAVALSRGLRNEAVDAGAFLTRAWFAHHGGYPTAAQYDAIDALEVLDLDAFAAQLQRDGAARLILPAHDDPIFEGRLVILTDINTASTSEPLVYLFQQQGVTVIGERTAGAMLSAEHFSMNETFRLFVPVADYVAPDGTRLDRRGVRPDIEVPGDQALERALRFIESPEES